MRNTAKLTVACVLTLGALFVFLSSGNFSRIGAAVFSDVAVATPTPPANGNTKAANMPPINTVNKMANVVSAPANVVANTSAVPTSGGKMIKKSFRLGTNSYEEHGEVPFDHETHASKNYSPDGKSEIGCVECHHTDQPKSAMKPPLVTSERNEILTMAVYQKSDQKVSTCRSCHFQVNDVPEGKTIPVLNKLELNNEIAYHKNCNVCHDAANKLRPDIKAKNKTFATGADCFGCHARNE